jgi:multidrug efflux pump
MDSLFYRDSRLLILVISLILVAGLSSYAVLPRLEDPVLTRRAALVNTLLPGADAERVEALVTEKIEDELQEIEEIKEVRSSSRPNISTIIIELRDDVYEADAVWSRVRDKLGDVTPFLPAEASSPEFDEAEVQAYAYIAAVTWDIESEPKSYAILRRWAKRLEDRFRSIPGTRETKLFGEPAEEFLVELDPRSLVALNLSFEDVARQLRSSDAKVSAGSLNGADNRLLLAVDGELDGKQRIESTPIRVEKGASHIVRIRDIGKVSRAIQEPSSSLAIIDGKPAVVVAVLVRDDFRIDRWHKSAEVALASFTEELPGGLGLAKVFSQNQYVSERLQKLQNNLVLGVLAVVGVVFFMMGWRSALVVGISLPLSALMVLAGMRWLGVPIHQMSITGLIIAMGLLIDNAIVVVDEIRERTVDGDAPVDAVSKSVRHLAIPLAGSTLTTALAFAPIALMPGPAGEFVGAISISVILAIFSSLLLALTVIPALAALLQGTSSHAHDASDRAPSHETGGVNPSPAFWIHGLRSNRMTATYRRTLEFVFRFPVLGIAIGCTFPAIGFILSLQLQEQFFPPADRDQIQIEVEASAQSSMAGTIELTERIRDILNKHAAVDRVHWFVGETAPSFYYNIIPRRRNTPRYAHALVQLADSKQARRVIHQLQATMDKEVPEARILVRQLEQGPPFDAPVEVRIFGPDLNELRLLGEQVRAELAAIPEVIHVRSELSEPSLKIALDVNEANARMAGIQRESLAGQLNSTYDGALGGSVLEATEELPVRVRLAAAQRGKIDELRSFDILPVNATAIDGGESVTGYDGVPLTSLAGIRLQAEFAAIPHFNSQRMNEIQAFIPAGELPSTVLAKFQKRLKSLEWQLPNGYYLEYGGETEKRNDAVGNLVASVGVLIVMMVATLVLSFGSFRMASIIGSVGMLSVGLGLGALYLFGYPFGFMAIVGTMGLAGVAINDSIVVLAAIRSDPAARAGNAVAISAVVVRASRHVLATSLTTIAGFLPLIMGGGGFWPPLAVAIAGGVAGATLLALYFVPAAYRLSMCPRQQAAIG